MRFVLAIVAFIAAAVMIGFGIAQRTVFLEPDRIAVSTEIEGQAAYTVIEPDALDAYSGKQTLTVSGSETVFVSYGRTSDVEAWLGDAPYVSVTYDEQAQELTSEVVVTKPVDDDGSTATTPPATTPPATPDATTEPAEPDPANSPAGSDLWLDEFSDSGPITTTIDPPDDISISVLLASDGTQPAPPDIELAWPLDNATPWAGPLLAGGALVFLGGIILLISGFMHHRRSRGPRRNLPKGKLPSAPKPPSLRKSQVTGGRRAVGRAKRVVILPLLVIPAMALSACSADYWPTFDQAPESTAPATETPVPSDEPAADADDDEGAAMEPAVSVPQMERIMRRVAVFANDADAALDTTAVAERFDGPALDARVANYTIRATLPDQPAPTAIPASPLTLTLPQQVDGWPASGRTVLTIAKNADDPTVAPTALVMQQAAPRENYKIVYAMSLAPDADVPEVAPASIGSPLISPEFKGLVLPPGEVGAAYADVLLKGDESEFATLFDPEGDVLREQLGVTGQQAIDESLPATADIAFSNVVGDSPTVALATNDSGALVTVSLEQTEKVTPNDGGTIGFEAGAPGAALSGFTEKSAKGVQRVIGVQLMFYVPSVGSDEQIRLLGWSESLIGASEVP